MQNTLQTITDSILNDWIGADTLSRIYTSEIGNNRMNFPPYDIIKIDTTKYEIRVAVSGFSEQDIEVEVEGETLTISGNSKSESKPEYIHKGISTKNFVRVFKLMDNVEVISASVKDGIVSVSLERFVPETKKKKKIPLLIGN